MIEEPRYIGPGFPFRYGPNGYFNTQKEEALIKSSILQILNTKQGERVMRPDFGSRIHLLLHEPNDGKFKALLEEYTREALAWEPRIEVLAIEINPRLDPGGHVAQITVVFSMKRTGRDSELIHKIERLI